MTLSRLGLALVLLAFSAGAAWPAELDQLLKSPTDKLRLGIDPRTPLKDALAKVGKLHEIKIDVDTAAFAKEGLRDIEELPCELFPLKAIPLGVLLQFLLDSLDADAVYEVRKDRLVIVPGKPKPPVDERDTDIAKKLAERLAAPTDKLRPGIDPGTTLITALEAIGKLHGVQIIVHKRSFRGKGNVEERVVGLSPVIRTPLRKILQDVLDEAGMTYVIQNGGYVLVVPKAPKQE
jgi:hypothetical protein